MKRQVLAFAALAAIGFSSAAFPGEASHQLQTTGSGATQMSDAEMDTVVAGQASGANGVANSGNVVIDKFNPPGSHLTCINCTGGSPETRALSANTENNNGNVTILTINPPGNHLNCINCP